MLSLYNAVDGGLYRGGTIVAMTNHLVAEIEGMCGYKLGNEVHLVPGWADTRRGIQVRDYLVGGNARFVTAGAIQAHKGIGLIVEAARMLRDSRVENFMIDVYGEGDQAFYIDMCKQLNVAEKVRFLGSRTQDELLEIYEHSDAFLFPTWQREPFGFAPVEAASVGCVPVLTDICGASERLVNNVHCIKITRDASSLASKMMDICNGDLDLKDLGTAGQIIARQDLSFASCLDIIEGVLSRAALSLDESTVPDRSSTNLAYLKHNLVQKMSFAW